MKTNGHKNESKKSQARRWALNWMALASEREEAGDLDGYRLARESARVWAERAGDLTLCT